MSNHNAYFPIVAKTFFGLESVLANEMTQLGVLEVKAENRAVTGKVNIELLYKCNYHLRAAIKILKPIHQFTAKDEDALYQGAQAVDWLDHFDLHQTFVIENTVYSSLFTHSQYVALKVKDAIADQFKARSGRRPSVNREEPDIKIHVNVHEDQVTLSLDSSGDALFKRGYRKTATEAPINEVLAAGLIGLSGWQGENDFLDPMCGSGTFLVEAALMATHTPPGSFRNKYGFQQWRDYHAATWRKIKREARKQIIHPRCKVRGSDINEEAVDAAMNNIVASGMDEIITLKKRDFFERKAEQPSGTILFNPPYDERLKVHDIGTFYRNISDHLKEAFSGWKAWVITSNLEALSEFALKPDHKFQVYNGALDSRFCGYELYEGSRKEEK